MTSAQSHEALRAFVDHYRARCLWFLREDYYPATPDEWNRVFRQIETHGDVEAFRRVAEARAWLSQQSNATSASS